ncbi:MAG TPA: diacylglycerol kinase family protein [Pseudonocardiaceae bacterium]|jgi:YegS/Rv2252/BmrU family lipid kinase
MSARPVAVIAHRKKSIGGGLDELRRMITDEGCDNLLWCEVSKSSKAAKKARLARKAGAELVFVWGGDGMVQRCVDALAGSNIPVAIVPAGTANLLAANLDIPQDVAQAVRIGFHGRRRTLDLGKVNGEHFAVMAGAGFDGAMISEAGRNLKDRVGRLAYLWTGLHHVKDGAVPVKIHIDGTKWFDGRASCVLLGNVGRITGGILAFDNAKPDDGWLDVGVATAEGALEWARTFGRMVAGRSDRSPFVRITRAKTADIRFGAPLTYELDGGARDTAKRLKAKVAPGALTVCVPRS